MGVTAIDTAAQEADTNWTKPTSLTTYRIYPGGPSYTVQAVSDTLQAISLQPDPQTNPLGLFYRDGTLMVNSNVTVCGSLFCTGDIQIAGTSIVFQPVALPALAGTTTAVRLAAASCQNATVKAGGGANITGLVAVFDTFLIESGSENMAFSLSGQLATQKLQVKERQPWDTLNWKDYYDSFIAKLLLFPSTTSKYFPVWMATQGRSPVPLLVFAPENPTATYHWANSYDPIFVPHPDDGGMRWDLLSWSENP